MGQSHDEKSGQEKSWPLFGDVTGKIFFACCSSAADGHSSWQRMGSKSRHEIPHEAIYSLEKDNQVACN